MLIEKKKYGLFQRNILSLCLTLSLTGCGLLSDGQAWGENAFTSFGGRRFSRAAHNSLFDLQTLIPAAGAMIFLIDDLDEKVSRWASKHHPVFGSKQEAIDAADNLRNALLAEAAFSTFLTPGGDDPGDWFYYKAKGLGAELIAGGVTEGVTQGLKETVRRERPDGNNRASFPSGHTSEAFSFATISNRNIETLPLPRSVKLPLQIGNIGIAASVAWARVEGKNHFPSDVLAGAALGHFFTAFIYDSLLGLPQNERFGLVVIPLKNGAMFDISYDF